MNIHSFESFGTVDGPGVRFIVFTQGCPLRCLYCHNPDTWDPQKAAKTLSPQEIFNEISKYRSYIKSGGVTLSGGEPLLQAKEAAELFKICKNNSIHTALDTAGILLNEQVKELLSVTDLVLLDIKSIDSNQFRELTGGELSKTLEFLDYLESQGVKTWIRHVVVPGYTDSSELLAELSRFLTKYSVVERIELLPYHSLGVSKYENLGLEYPLKDTIQLSKERLDEIKPIFADLGHKI